MKKVLFLGGAPTQIPPIRYAVEQGYYTIVCDFKPENPGHEMAHRAYDVSTTDLNRVLQVAEEHDIDAIVAYASDPAAPTAAYVAEKLGLPGNPYDAVLTLARKDLFREFLRENDFNVPASRSFQSLDEAVKAFDEMDLPVFVKPVDSSGSKGVTEVLSHEEFPEAFDAAFSFSREGRVIVEEKIERSGYQVAGDGFMVDGKLAFRCWADEHFDKLCNGLVPIGQTFPSSHTQQRLAHAHHEAQRLLSLLGMRFGALNFDFIFDKSGNLYFLEIGPRNGGCKIPEVIAYATGVDLVQYTVEAALGNSCSDLTMTDIAGYWSSYMVHAIKNGTFQGILKSDRIRELIIEESIYATPGDPVRQFSGSNDTLGEMIIKYQSLEQMLDMVDNMERDILVEVS